MPSGPFLTTYTSNHKEQERRSEPSSREVGPPPHYRFDTVKICNDFPPAPRWLGDVEPALARDSPLGMLVEAGRRRDGVGVGAGGGVTMKKREGRGKGVAEEG